MEQDNFEAELAALEGQTEPTSLVLGDTVTVEPVAGQFWENGLEPSWFYFTD